MKQPDIEEITLIEKYFDFELSEEELKHFDNLYQQEDFRQKVKNFEAAKNYIDKKYWATGKQLIQEKRNELEKTKIKKSNKKVFPLFRFGIAAGVLILLGVIFWNIFTPDPGSTLASITQSSYELADGTTNLDPLELTIRSGSASSKNELWQAYQTKDWPAILQMTDSAPTNASTLLIRGIAHYQQADYNAALLAFENSLSLNEGTEDNLLWWLSSTHLQLNQKQEAQTILEQIIAKNYPTAEQAKNLLDNIEALK